MAWWLCRSYAYSGPGFGWMGADVIEEKRSLYGSGLSLSYALSAANVPKAARYRQPYVLPPSPDIFFVDSAVTVTKRFKDLVESFEPGLHLFVAVELQYHDGRPITGDFYFFNCNVDVDCLLTGNGPEWFHTTRFGETKPALNLLQESSPIQIRLSAPAIRGRHLWTGGVLGWNQLFVSDDFAAALRKGDFRELDFRKKCIEVDQLWNAADNAAPLFDKWEQYRSSGGQRHPSWV